MSNIYKVIKNRKTDLNPIWIMRQAGRYLPEFREIRKKNTDFIKLCLNSSLSAEITLQPLKRFDLDAAIIFSDILILPYGLKQKVEFKKNIGPILGDLNFDQAFKVTESDFIERVDPVYKAINLVRNNNLTENKSTIGFVGAPWTLLVYILNKQSPKIKLKENFFKDFSIIEKTLKIKLKRNKAIKKILSPGMMKKHYSPGIPVLINQNKHDGKSAYIYIGNKYKNRKNFFSLNKENNLNLAASNLYKLLRMIKKKGYKKIQINKIPNYGAGIAINDRINRASKF